MPPPRPGNHRSRRFTDYAWRASFQGDEMTIDELISRLMRLSEESSHRGTTEVLLKFESHVETEGANLGRAQLPRGQAVKSPVAIIQAKIAHRCTPRMRMPGRTDGPDEDLIEQQVHAEV